MKRYIITLLAATALLTVPLCIKAQPHPNQGFVPGTESNGRVGQHTDNGGAPIGNGTLILMALAMAYAGHKTYKLNQQEEE